MAYYRGRIFDGFRVRSDGVVGCEKNEVIFCGPENLVPVGVKIQQLDRDLIISPRFLDLQFNGIGKEDLRFPIDIQAIEREVDKQGLSGIFATAISSTDYTGFLANLQILKDKDLLVGVHFEGPFLGLTGVHPAAAIDSSTRLDPKIFLSVVESAKKIAGNLPVIVTVSPDVLPRELFHGLTSLGVYLSLGHSNVSDEAATSFFDDHPLVTHLFNAMGSTHHRKPGIAMTALLHPRTYVCLIGDGVHVHPKMVELAFRLKRDRLALVSDMVPMDAATWPGSKDSGVIRGGQMSLLDQVSSLAAEFRISWEELLKHVTSVPGRILGQNHFITPGFKGGMMTLRSKDNRVEIVDFLR